MPTGKRPDLNTYIKGPDNKLLKLTSQWKQAKGQFTGKIEVTQELTSLMVPGATLQVVSFPDRPAANANQKAEQHPAVA